MAWYSDEQYSMIQDCREKKSTAASAFKQRTHCGKGGGVKLPSDYMSRKEIKAMNGECVSYRMGDPITWEVFKTWPEEHQKNYIVNVREKFKVPNTALAKAMGADKYTLGQYVKCLGLGQGKEAGAVGRYWHETEDSTRFWSWWNGEEISEIEETPDLRKPMSWGQFKSMSSENKKSYIEWIRYLFEAPDKYIADTLFRVSAITLRKELTELDLNSGKKASGRGMKVWNKESFIAWCDQNKKPVEEGPVTKVDTPVVDIFEMRKDTENTDVEATREEIVESVNPVEQAFQEAVEHIEKAEKEFNCTETCELADDCECKRIHDAGPIAFTGNQIPVIPKSGSMTFENNCADDIITVLKTLLGGVRVTMSVSWEVN